MTASVPPPVITWLVFAASDALVNTLHVPDGIDLGGVITQIAGATLIADVDKNPVHPLGALPLGSSHIDHIGKGRSMSGLFAFADPRQ